MRAGERSAHHSAKPGRRVARLAGSALLCALLLGMGSYPKQRVVVLPSAACPLSYELELPPTRFRKAVVLVSGLAVGDCVDLDLGARPRICCPTTQRPCGPIGQDVALRPCKRVLRP